uniref:Protein kinase domain-containing protein n=1 Tax=Leersia perrieri TaxID=77586 RepID=A0A0D9X3R6_9ORYZ
MGCVSSKQFHGEDQRGGEGKPRRRPSSSNSLRRLVSYNSSKRHEHFEEDEEEGVVVSATSSSAGHRVGNDPSTTRLIRKPPVPVVEAVAVAALPDEAASVAVGVVDAERPVAAPANWRRAPNGVAEQEPQPRSGVTRSEAKPRITDVPNGVPGEHVAAGWPRWLTEVAAEAVRGWQPRKAESFEKLDKIGQGTYSSVYKARDLESGKIVALKKVRFANMDPESVRFMAREIHILRRLDHPNVIKLEGLVTSRMSSSLYLVFEYMEHDLAGLAATPGIKFTEPQVKCYMQQLLSGLEHCHNRGVLHRDIKGANLLLDNNGVLKIADFGLATFFNPNQKQHLTSRVVTLWYRPPELLLGATNYGAAVDLWSAGCILAELLSGKPIMPGRTEVEQLHKIFKLCGSPSEDFWANLKLSRATIFKPQHPYRRCVNDVYKDFPPPALALLDCLLAVEPENRGTAGSALGSEFFTTKPYACDPSSLPKYPPSKEYDAKLRDEEARRQRAAAVKGHEADAGRRKQLPAPNGNNELQQRRAMLNAKSSNNKFIPKEDTVTGFPIDPPGRAGDNVYPQRAPLMHAGRSSSTLGRSTGTDQNAQRFYTSQIAAADMSTATGGQRGNATKVSNLGDSARRQYLREHRSSSRYSQLTAAEPSDRPEWTNQFQERPSSSHRKDDGATNKEPTVVNGAKKSRIHYSGPLMPPGVNMEEILREHERQIQQAHLFRIRRCIPPVWRNAAPAQQPSPPPPPSPRHPASSLSGILYSCAAHRARRPGEQVHARAVALGLVAHPSLLPRLASFYLALDDLSAARAAVELAAGRGRAFPWNLLIWGYAGHGMWEEAIMAYEKMVDLGVAADKFTFPSVLRACGELREVDIGRKIEQRVRRSRFGLDMYVWNALVGMYAKCGEIEDARRVFDGMAVRDVVSWNTMVSVYALAGKWGKAFELLQQVPGANIVTWNAVAAGNLKAGNYDEVIRLVSQVRRCHGEEVDYVNVMIGLKACGRNGYLRFGRELHGVAVRLCFDGLECVVNSLITMYSRCRMMNSACLLFGACSIRSITTWNSLLAGFAFMDQIEEASLLFREMIGSSVCPNDVTILVMLSLAARFGHLCHGRELHCYIIKHQLDGSKLLENSLVDMYSKCRQMVVAQSVFELMQFRDKHAYTSLILGYGLQREGHVSLKLFDDMIENSIEPDHVTMVALLSACSYSRLVTQGQLLFAQMASVFGIAPRVEHFSCTVDLYCREGLLKMAEEIIDKMPFQPTAAMLATLIEACRIHGYMEVGDRAAKKLLAMRTNNPGHYKLIANMYIEAKCWPELANVRSLMSTMELNMIPSHSLLESEYDACPVEQDDFLNHVVHGCSFDYLTDTDSSSSEEVKCSEAFGG